MVATSASFTDELFAKNSLPLPNVSAIVTPKYPTKRLPREISTRCCILGTGAK